MIRERKIRIAIACPSEIACRRFLPALKKIDAFEFAGIGVCLPSEIVGASDMKSASERSALQRAKAEEVVHKYGGTIFEGYDGPLRSDAVDAIYIPLPPALHYEHARKALMAGKHVLVEKPATCRLSDTKSLIALAESQNLALHENFMFAYHRQIESLREIIDSGSIGDVRLYRMSFGFPKRDSCDFRYNQDLGGGALMDAGGYTIKLANMLLGDSAGIKAATLNHISGFNVDVYGSGMYENENGIVAQIAFGMDNAYRCELEVWGSRGILTAGRIFTAPDGLVPPATLCINGSDEEIALPADDSFANSINHFLRCIEIREKRYRAYRDIEYQAMSVEQFKKMAMREPR